MKTQRLLLTSVVASTLALAGACDTQSCTDAGCGPLLTFFVEGPDAAALPDGSYEVVVDLDGSVYTSTCVVADPSSFACEDFEGEAPFRVSGNLVGNLGTLRFSVYEDDPSDLTVKQVSVMVDVEGNTVTDESWSPEYETHRPNGEECGPTCTQATEAYAFVAVVPES